MQLVCVAQGFFGENKFKVKFKVKFKANFTINMKLNVKPDDCQGNINKKGNEGK